MLGGPKQKRPRAHTGFEIGCHLATRPRARTNDTNRFPDRIHSPTSDAFFREIVFIVFWVTTEPEKRESNEHHGIHEIV